MTPQESEAEHLRDPRWQLALRVAESRDFQKAPRLRDFLLYVCREAILGKAEKLAEHQIGCAVFGRRPDYSPADDSIVRVQARQLRLRLADYFRSEGLGEATTIDIPKGTYVPVFSNSAALSHDAAPAPQPRGRFILSSRAAAWALGAIAAMLGVACAVLLVQNHRLTRMEGAGIGAERPWVLSKLFENGQGATVIGSDPGFGNIQGLLNRTLSLEDYLRPGYPEALMPPGGAPQYSRIFHILTVYPLSSLMEVVIANRLGKLGQQFNWPFTIRHPREIEMRDLTRGNQLLLGSTMSNPWVSLYEKHLTFQSEWDTRNQVVVFRNTSPQKGERPAYASAGPNGVPGSAFAVIALLNGPQPAAADSRVLILEGTKGEATEAAWDLVADPRQLDARLSNAGFDPVEIHAKRGLEILLETRALAGAHGEVLIRALLWGTLKTGQ